MWIYICIGSFDQADLKNYLNSFLLFRFLCLSYRMLIYIYMENWKYFEMLIIVYLIFKPQRKEFYLACVLNFHQVAGVPGVTEALFLARQAALAQEKNGSKETPMLYSCGLCGKGYRSSKAHAEHLKSRSHILRASQGIGDEEEDKAIVTPLPSRAGNKAPPKREENDEESEESGDEWEEVDPEDELVSETAKSLTDLNVDGHASNEDMDEDDEDDYEELDPSGCFMCDREHKTIESCMVHMHKHHGFFIPDIEYLKDPKGLLTYIGLKVLKYMFHVFFFF